MNKIDETAKRRALVNKHIAINENKLIDIRSGVDRLAVSETVKKGYIELIDKKLEQLKAVQINLSKPNNNTYDDFITVQKQARLCINLVQDINSINAHLRVKTANQKQVDLSYSLPNAPTHPIIIKKPQAQPMTVPAVTLEKVVAMNAQLSAVKGSIDKLVFIMPNKTTEEKVYRSAMYQTLHKQQQALQFETDSIGQSLHKRSTPLTAQQTISINEKLTALEQKIAAFCNQISNKLLAHAPQAPTGFAPPSDDESPTTRGPRR